MVRSGSTTASHRHLRGKGPGRCSRRRGRFRGRCADRRGRAGRPLTIPPERRARQGARAGGVPPRTDTPVHCGVPENTTPLARDLAAIVGPRFVRSRPSELLTFAADGLPTHRAIPACVVFPGSTRDVSALLRHLHAAGVPFVARGAGTGLSGGALAEAPAVLVALTRMARILGVDPGTAAPWWSPASSTPRWPAAAAPHGLHYAPDPSSQTACTIGGNVAENAGGPHCLKYGVTTNHVLGLEVVLRRRRGRAARQRRRRPCRATTSSALFVGCEGTFGIATEITVRLVPLPPSGAHDARRSSRRCGRPARPSRAIIAAGIVPAALEMMDQQRHPSRGGVPSTPPATRRTPRAVLLVELRRRARRRWPQTSTRSRPSAATPARARSASREHAAERERLWQGRKKAFGAMGRISAELLVQDAMVPRTRAARRARARRGDRRALPACASPTSSTPATATCTPT